jgi:type IV pilus assembly protein PilA
MRSQTATGRDRHDRGRSVDCEQGFTLIELMVVVLVIAILLGIAIPTFLGARSRAQDGVAKSSVRNALTAARILLDGGTVASAASMATEEPAFTYTSAASTGPKQISVVASGPITMLAAKSDSGKCFTTTVGVDLTSEVVATSQPVCSGATAATTPQALPNIVLWYDAADPTTLSTSSGNVSAWRDKSGRGNHLAPAGAVLGPTVATGAANGLDTLRFDGSQELQAPHSSSLAIAGTGLTIFAVYNDSVAGASTDALLINKEQSWELGSQSDVIRGAVSTATPRNWAWIGSATSSANQWHTVSLRRSPTDFTFVLDGVSSSAATAPTGAIWPFSDVLTVGGRALYAHRWVGDIAEIVVYDGALTDGQETAVRSYLQAKWATP